MSQMGFDAEAQRLDQGRFDHLFGFVRRMYKTCGVLNYGEKRPTTAEGRRAGIKTGCVSSGLSEDYSKGDISLRDGTLVMVICAHHIRQTRLEETIELGSVMANNTKSHHFYTLHRCHSLPQRRWPVVCAAGGWQKPCRKI